MRFGAFICMLGAAALLQVSPFEARGRQADQAVAAAIGNLTDASQGTRWKAARALRELGARAEAAVTALARTAGADSSINVQVEAILALGAIGKRSPAAVDALSGVVSGRTGVPAMWAVIALGDAGAGAKAAVPTLVEFLEAQTDPEGMILAIITLGRIGPPARPALPAIEKHLGDTRVVPEWGEVAERARASIELIRKSSLAVRQA